MEGHLLSQGDYSITTKVTFKNSGLSWTLTNAYGPNEQSERKKLFQELTLIKEKNQGPWVLLGDFKRSQFRFRKERERKQLVSFPGV